MTKPITPLAIVVALAVTLALIAGACGGDDDDSGDAAPTASEPSDGDSGDAGGDVEGDPVAGAEVYASVCTGCHGADAEGIDGVGKPLTGSAFVAETSSGDLVVLVTEGRSADHPDNTQGVAMPPKGGNPSLTEQDIADVVAYIKSLN